jgi:hypothetical protein
MKRRSRTINGRRWTCRRPGYWVNGHLHCIRMFHGLACESWEVYSPTKYGKLVTGGLTFLEAAENVKPPPKRTDWI